MAEIKKIEKPKSNVKVINLAQVETDYPYQSENRRYVNYGSENLYPEYLLDLYLYSPTNNAVIAATSQMIAGGGVTVDETTSPLAAKELAGLLTQSKILKTAFNLKTYGYAVWLVTTTDRVIDVEPQNSGDWRSGVKDANGNVNDWWYSADWEKATGNYKPEPTPIFKTYSTNVTEVLVITIPKLGFDYYPPVDYSGGVASIQLESEICEFHLSAIQNGLAPSTIMNFNNGVPPDEEQGVIERDVKNKFGGSSNAGKFFLSFNDNKDNATTFETMPITDIDKQYEFLSKETTNKILLSHRVTTPLLFGIRDIGGGLGNNADELKDGYILYYETAIKPYQEIIGEGIADILFKNNLTAILKWEEYMPFMREKETQLAEEVRLTENDIVEIIGKYTKKIVKTDNLIQLNEKSFDGLPKTGESSLTRLYKFNVINKNHKDVLFKVMEKAAKDGHLYTYDEIKDFPKRKGMFWSEITYKKSK